MLYITFLKNVLFIQKCYLFCPNIRLIFGKFEKLVKIMTFLDFCREFKNPIFNPRNFKNKNRS